MTPRIAFLFFLLAAFIPAFFNHPVRADEALQSGYTISGPFAHDNLAIFLIHGADKISGKTYLTLQEAMEVGDVKVKACGMTMDLFDMKLTDLEPVVSEVTGVASFIEQSEGGTTLFI